MKKKLTREQLLQMDAVDVYKLVLSKRIKAFPSGFWSLPEAMDNAGKCTRFLIEEILSWDEEKLLSSLTQQVLKDYKLKGMLTSVFNDVLFSVLDNAYKGKYKPWQLKTVSRNLWLDDENCKEAVLWLMHEKLQYSDEDIRNRWSKNTFADNGLEGLLVSRFNGSPYQALNFVRPNEFNPNDLASTQKKYFDDEENVVKSLINCFKYKLGLSKTDALKVPVTEYSSYGLSTIVCNKNYKIEDLRRIVSENWDKY